MGFITMENHHLGNSFDFFQVPNIRNVSNKLHSYIGIIS